MPAGAAVWNRHTVRQSLMWSLLGGVPDPRSTTEEEDVLPTMRDPFWSPARRASRRAIQARLRGRHVNR